MHRWNGWKCGERLDVKCVVHPIPAIHSPCARGSIETIKYLVLLSMGNFTPKVRWAKSKTMRLAKSKRRQVTAHGLGPRVAFPFSDIMSYLLPTQRKTQQRPSLLIIKHSFHKDKPSLQKNAMRFTELLPWLPRWYQRSLQFELHRPNWPRSMFISSSTREVAGFFNECKSK